MKFHFYPSRASSVLYLSFILSFSSATFHFHFFFFFFSGTSKLQRISFSYTFHFLYIYQFNNHVSHNPFTITFLINNPLFYSNQTSIFYMFHFSLLLCITCSFIVESLFGVYIYVYAMIIA